MECLIDNLPIYYEEHGEGKPILCLHGFSIDHRSMKGCIEPILQNTDGYRRIYLDMPGTGKTPAVDWIGNADDMVNLLKRFVSKVIGDESFLLVGCSYGGYLSLGMAFAGDMNIDGIFLLVPVTVDKRDQRKLPVVTDADRFICKDLQHPDPPNTYFEGFVNHGIVVTTETWNRFNQEIFPALEIADRAFLDNYLKNGYALSFGEKMKDLQFTKPVTVLCGRQDTTTGYQDPWDMLQHLPRITYVALDRAGHSPQIENPAAFNFHFKDWLSKI